jgi:cyclopropane fatty-acyl-phospholipid synthase-like methyltransferase
MNKLNKAIINEFWHRTSLKDSNRWTSSNILDFEYTYLAEIIGNFKSMDILDLGCGSGDLSRRIMKKEDTLVAVDYISNYARFYNEEDNQYFKTQDLLEFSTKKQFDLILLFGVVTYLELTEETEMYKKIKLWLRKGGLAVIKNQVSLTQELVVNEYSTNLEFDYSSRYPSLESQTKIINQIFGNCRVLTYPEQFNTFKNTIHVSYVIEEQS